MSRVGLNPITIEEGVQVSVEKNIVTVSGDGKELNISFPEVLTVEVKDNVVQVNRKNDEKQSKSVHGTIRMLISNAINGVKNGFEKKLELVGVGYRAKMEGTTLVMSLGLNHPVKFESPEGITIEVPEETKVVLKGYDKQKLGEFAAKVRATRKPEPYKGKGIRYEGEYVRRKSSKSGIGA
ncbi:MAG: 50S ribosomal protein L6 [candidate division WS6 bacterium GW2011_GWE1_34_7]|uniref:Large ribosomal subunit protein uL6 n=1 Tax=candidate division WS6 bacterium GW2011_GWE1_34_7 TaxID=1619093 RepID=A0A0G0B8K9_9BACT|nr:MAG: 50S ribosomal protein L6 [candidate division WS6 bacterium GW2011_GWE1_34_7]